MEDRVKLGNGKSSILRCPSAYSPADFSEFLADLKNGLFVDVTPNNDTDTDPGVSVVGTPLNKANLLPDATAQGFGFSVSDNPTVGDVLNRISNDYITATLLANQTSVTVNDSRIKTTSTIDAIFTDIYGVTPKNVTVSNGSMTLAFSKSYPSAVQIRIRLF